MNRILLAVRDFALPVPRTGSIESHSGYRPTPFTGQEAHRIVQSQRIEAYPNYRSEVWVSHTFSCGAYEFVVSGRMDGIFDGPSTKIEEVKAAFNVEDLKRK